MIKKALTELTVISEDDNDNMENYMDALNYLDNIYKVVNIIKQDMPIDQLTFLPSFKSKNIVERLGIISDDKETELKYFIISSKLFVSDSKLVTKIKKQCENIADNFETEKDIIRITLK